MSPSASVATWLDANPSALDDDALLTGTRELGELRRTVDAALSAFAAEAKHRSRREDGFGGLAQRLGAGTPRNSSNRCRECRSVKRRHSYALGNC